MWVTRTDDAIEFAGEDSNGNPMSAVLPVVVEHPPGFTVIWDAAAGEGTGSVAAIRIAGRSDRERGELLPVFAAALAIPLDETRGGGSTVRSPLGDPGDYLERDVIAALRCAGLFRWGHLDVSGGVLAWERDVLLGSAGDTGQLEASGGEFSDLRHALAEGVECLADLWEADGDVATAGEVRGYLEQVQRLAYGSVSDRSASADPAGLLADLRGAFHRGRALCLPPSTQTSESWAAGVDVDGLTVSVDLGSVPPRTLDLTRPPVVLPTALGALDDDDALGQLIMGRSLTAFAFPTAVVASLLPWELTLETDSAAVPFEADFSGALFTTEPFSSGSGPVTVRGTLRQRAMASDAGTHALGEAIATLSTMRLAAIGDWIETGRDAGLTLAEMSAAAVAARLALSDAVHVEGSPGVRVMVGTPAALASDDDRIAPAAIRGGAARASIAGPDTQGVALDLDSPFGAFGWLEDLGGRSLEFAVQQVAVNQTINLRRPHPTAKVRGSRREVWVALGRLSWCYSLDKAWPWREQLRDSYRLAHRRVWQTAVEVYRADALVITDPVVRLGRAQGYQILRALNPMALALALDAFESHRRADSLEVAHRVRTLCSALGIALPSLSREAASLVAGTELLLRREAEEVTRERQDNALSLGATRGRSPVVPLIVAAPHQMPWWLPRTLEGTTDPAVTVDVSVGRVSIDLPSPLLSSAELASTLPALALTVFDQGLMATFESTPRWGSGGKRVVADFSVDAVRRSAGESAQILVLHQLDLGPTRTWYPSGNRMSPARPAADVDPFWVGVRAALPVCFGVAADGDM